MKNRSSVVVLALLLTLPLIYLSLPAKYRLLDRPYQDPQPSETATNPASEYAIGANEMDHLQFQAKNGDCQAAARLGKHYMNYELNFNNAVKWFRVAARCPDVAPKEYLIMLLRQVGNDPAIDAELDRLVSEVRAIDPARAAELETIVKQMRH